MRYPHPGEWVEDPATGRQGTVQSCQGLSDSVIVRDSNGTTIWTAPLAEILVKDGDLAEPDDDAEPLDWLGDVDRYL